MFENDENNGFFAGSDELDLGSSTGDDFDFSVFDGEMGSVFENTETTAAPNETPVQEQTEKPVSQTGMENASTTPETETTADYNIKCNT